MSLDHDAVGNLLREFYSVYGMSDEGPPQDLNVSAVLGTDDFPKDDYELLTSALSDNTLRREFLNCRNLLEDLANRLTTEELLHEMSSISLSDREAEELSSGVAWFTMAASLDKRQDGSLITPFDEQLALPLPLKIRLVVQGSLVLRLYIALVYMREGALNNVVSRASRSGNPCSARVQKLLNSNYVRYIRNALSHGTFSTCVVGIVFRDEESKKKTIVVATPKFLEWLCLWLMLIQLQVFSAVLKD